LTDLNIQRRRRNADLPQVTAPTPRIPYDRDPATRGGRPRRLLPTGGRWVFWWTAEPGYGNNAGGCFSGGGDSAW